MLPPLKWSQKNGPKNSLKNGPKNGTKNGPRNSPVHILPYAIQWGPTHKCLDWLLLDAIKRAKLEQFWEFLETFEPIGKMFDGSEYMLLQF